MGQVSGSKVVTDGLVFSYDSESIRSYAGPPIQNMATTMVASGSFSGPSIAYTAGTEKVKVPSLGVLNVPYMEGYNSNSASYCCLQQFYFVTGNGYVPASGSTTYTYGIVYRTTSGYHHPNYMYRYEYNSSGGYVTEAGVHDSSKRIHLGDDWYWAWNTFTTQATTTRLYLRSFYYQYNVLDRHSVAKVLVTPGDYTGLHPRLWPEIGTTRSNTQALLDLTDQNTITATELTYNSNGSFSFDGSNDGLTTSVGAAALGITTELTISIFTKRAASPTNVLQGQVGFGSSGFVSIKNGTTSFFADINSATPTRYIVNIASSGSISNFENTWVNLCFTISGTSIKTYFNGALVNSTTMDTTISLGSQVFGVGNGFGYFRMQGELPVAMLYNRALSAEEVAQNFNALRGRYGI